MLNEFQITENVSNDFNLKLLSFGKNYENFAFFNSNKFNEPSLNSGYNEYGFLSAFGVNNKIFSLNDLKNTTAKNHGWLFGFLTYDLKNEIEKLNSNNIDELEFPDLHFFQPEIIFTSKNSIITVLYDENYIKKDEVFGLINKINNTNLAESHSVQNNVVLSKRFTREEYIETVKKIKWHIQRGDIYEANFCQEFYSIHEINPLNTYLKLNEISPTPFSCFFKVGDKYLISASPERFLKKIGNKVISQPIKGTIKRGQNDEEDNFLKNKLRNDHKERAENVMIVDLVRNDLSRTAKPGSVKVEELYGIYSFNQVHQMISTVVSEVEENKNIVDIIKNAFPMGSMTGAPKIRAMELIEEYEKTKRGLFSGAVGYISPDNNFDLNVVIRSILYNQSKNYVSFTVGGAITSLSNPEMEYEECMVKAEAMLKTLG